jgi:hypothetical protein
MAGCLKGKADVYLALMARSGVAAGFVAAEADVDAGCVGPT